MVDVTGGKDLPQFGHDGRSSSAARSTTPRQAGHRMYVPRVAMSKASSPWGVLSRFRVFYISIVACQPIVRLLPPSGSALLDHPECQDRTFEPVDYASRRWPIGSKVIGGDGF